MKPKEGSRSFSDQSDSEISESSINSAYKNRLFVEDASFHSDASAESYLMSDAKDKRKSTMVPMDYKPKNLSPEKSS